MSNSEYVMVEKKIPVSCFFTRKYSPPCYGTGYDRTDTDIDMHLAYLDALSRGEEFDFPEDDLLEL